MLPALKTTFHKFPQLEALGLCLFLILVGAGCSRHDSAAARPEATLEEMNAALNTWVMVKGGLPANVSELTNFPALKGKLLPVTPAGKKLAIDAARRQVVVIDVK